MAKSKTADLAYINEQLRPLAVPLERLKPDPKNARTHGEKNLSAIAASLKAYGQRRPCVVRKDNNVVIAGNGMLTAAKGLGWTHVAVIYVEDDDTTATGYAIADNRTAELANWDEEILGGLLKDMKDAGADISALGFDKEDFNKMLAPEMAAHLTDSVDASHQAKKGPGLTERFGVPPFSIFDARQGYWAERKRRWIDVGIRSEEGRGNDDDCTKDGLTFSKTSQPVAVYNEKAAMEKRLGREVSWDEFIEAHPDLLKFHGTSVFDPVLCEVLYRWFTPKGGSILDPFAGGSVRGAVAAALGFKYHGCDLRQEQIDANRKQWKDIKKTLVENKVTRGAIPDPVWKAGDSVHIKKWLPGTYDFVFSCPPYADLEVYSDDPNDLSNMSYQDFLAAYRRIIAASVEMLKPNRYAAFVVGDLRDEKGIYRNFVGDTIQAFTDAGAPLYNYGILITAIGSLPVRLNNIFTKHRKFGKTHQDVLVFVKGDPKATNEALGPVPMAEFTEVTNLVKREDGE